MNCPNGTYYNDTGLASEVCKKNQIFIILAVLRRSITSGEAHLRGLAPGQHNSEEPSKLWRAVGDSMSDLTDQEFKP